MAATVSALDRVLILPELLSTIFGCIGEDAPTLAACMRVNKAWAEEAVMFLWIACVSDFPGSIYQGLLYPKICDLAALAPYPDRLQWYARCIRSLEFGIEYTCTDGTRNTPTDASGHTSKYHPAFANIKFPRLAYLSLDGSGYSSSYTNGLALLQYLQPSLLSLDLQEGSISDEFLAMLMTRCPALKTLAIDSAQQAERKISEKAFIDCLQALHSLEKLSLRQGLGYAWSLQSFLAIATKESLKILTLSTIPTFSPTDLQNRLEPGSFINIKELTAGLSEDTLKLLLPYLAKMARLAVHLTVPSSRVLRITTASPSLRFLKLEFQPGSVIRAGDLILFAKAHSALESLELGPDDEDIMPSAEDFTDSTIDQIARLLPNLTILEFRVADTFLTEFSLLSLGTFCKRLVSCDIYGSFFFEDVVRSAQPNLFPALLSFRLMQTVSDRRQYTDPEETARRILQTAPSLLFLDLGYENLTESDIALQNAVNELAK